MSFFSGEFFSGGFFGASTSGGRRKRKRTRFAAKIDGKLKVFDTLADLEEFLASHREEKIDKAVEKVQKKKDVHFGAVSTGYAPEAPKFRVTRAEPDLVKIVEAENDRMRAEYIRIMLALKAQAEMEDEEEVAALLLS